MADALPAKGQDIRVCVIDNPHTMRREAWRNGQEIGSLSLPLMLTRGFCGHKHMPFYFNVGPWRDGAVYGDATALVEV